MEDSSYKGDASSFWDLLCMHQIEIPIIQRDYAQGRKGKEEILDRFLLALYESIVASHPIKLDFIYGSLDEDTSHPLDGQQRLTTLFLLHWYAATKDHELGTDNQNVFRKFTYETRISSREFCHAIVSNPIILSDDVKPSEIIMDSSWFFLSWKKDPTIDAMLRTIDHIHSKFYNIDDLWSKLTGSGKLIEFYHIDLEGIGLTDDLYIKMNARGKLLTSFENFKASLQKIINDNEWDAGRKFLETFAYKIDTKWTDLFWNHCGKDTDTAFMRLIATVMMIREVIKRGDNRLSNISALQDEYKIVKPSQFDKLDFEYLCSVLDNYSKIYASELKLKLDFPFFQHSPEGDIFSAIVLEGNNASYTQKAMFYAQTEYLSKNKDNIDKEKFSDWMRVVRNIISRGDVVKTGRRPTIIRSPQTFDGVINLIHELSEGCNDIYKHLTTVSSIKSQFAREQVEEEKLKARVIVSNTENREPIFNSEDTVLLQGKINFALYCVGFTEKSDISEFDKDKLNGINFQINSHFNSDSDISNDLRRALLTISDDEGKYDYYGYWWSFWNVVSANKRCLLDSSIRALEFYIYGNQGEYRIYLKKLIQELMNKSMQDITTNFIPPNDMPNWKVRLIKEPELLDTMCTSNHIVIPEDDSCCYLLKSLRPRDMDGCIRIE